MVTYKLMMMTLENRRIKCRIQLQIHSLNHWKISQKNVAANMEDAVKEHAKEHIELVREKNLPQ